MGGKSSTRRRTPPTPPPSPPTFETPWRQISWKNEPHLQYVKTFKLQKEEAKHVRILLYGPIGAGKTSFINSVKTILTEKMSGLGLANARNNDKASFTKTYETHKIKKTKDSFYPFVFTDLMGLEEEDGAGVRVHDIKMSMMGHVKDGYTFNPLAPITKKDHSYNDVPSPDDQVHVLVCVYPANVPKMDKIVLQNMKEIREEASILGIPQLAILTSVDEACLETKKDLKNVYKSKYINKKMKEFSTAVGIPLNCILPVKNYSEEIDLKEEVNSLILSALKLMIDFGDEYIDYKL